MTTHEERVRQRFSKQAFMSTLGAQLTAVVQGGVEIRLPFSPNLTQQNGYLHAGAITAVLDSACGYAALTVAADDKEVLTVELKVNLMAPAAGEVFAARAQVKKAGRTLTVCTADAFAISDGREKVVATMLATIIAVPITPARNSTRFSASEHRGAVEASQRLQNLKLHFEKRTTLPCDVSAEGCLTRR